MNASTITMTDKLLGASLCGLMALSIGCAGDIPVTDGDDEPGDSSDPGGPDDPDPPAPLDATGLYRLDSRFDVVSGMPGAVGEVSNTFIDMTDDPYDPATWVLDRLVAEVDSGFVRGAIEAGRPVIDGLLLDLMLDHAPQIVSDLIQLGDHFGQVSRRFGTRSTLEIVPDPDGATAIHVVSTYRFRIDGADHEFDIAELGGEPPVVAGIGFGFDGQRITVDEHAVPLRYGGFLALALEDVIVPLIDPSATSLAEMLNNLVDCTAVGAELSHEIGFGSASFYEGLCEIGLDAGARFVIDQLISIDEKAAVTLQIAGEARAGDQDGDRRIDRLTGGTWTGVIDYAGSRGDLPAEVNTFTGQRM
ncbi:MAG TPA: hypothetical protein VKZ63_00610 [Kofleriaceae bacterium]|nr:hypothetical protein [Kofleriaceae bacterium]